MGDELVSSVSERKVKNMADYFVQYFGHIPDGKEPLNRYIEYDTLPIIPRVGEKVQVRFGMDNSVWRVVEVSYLVGQDGPDGAIVHLAQAESS